MNQRGGNFAVVGSGSDGMLGAAPATDLADVAIWHTGIDAAGLGTAPLDLKILFTTAPVLTTDTTDKLKATRINTWFRFIGEQDTVALVAVTHVQRTFLKRVLTGAGGRPPVNPLRNGTKTYTTDAAIDALKGEELMSLIEEYEPQLQYHYADLMPILKRLIIQFEAVINMGEGATKWAGATSTNKFEQMFQDRLNDFFKTRQFIGVFLNPVRLTNVLMGQVVSILRMYLQDQPKLKKDIALVKNSRVEDFMEDLDAERNVNQRKMDKLTIIEKMMETCKGGVALLTNTGLQDGWVHGGPFVFYNFLDHPGRRAIPGTHDLYKVYDFWFQFYTQMAAQYDGTNFIPANFKQTDQGNYGVLAAKILVAKINSRTLEQILITPTPGDYVAGVPLDYRKIPNAEYIAVAYKPGFTLDTLYRSLDQSIDSRFAINLMHQLNKP